MAAAATAFKRLASVRLPNKKPPVQRNGTSVWQQLLAGASRKAAFEKSTILVVGRPECGKEALVRELQKVGLGSRKAAAGELLEGGGGGCGYAFINVRALEDNDETETLAKSDVWILQSTEQSNLLQGVLPAEALRHMAVVICLDLTEPWLIKRDLKDWLEFLTTFLGAKLNELPAEEQEALRLRNADYLANYRRLVQQPDSPPNPAEIAGLVNLGLPIVIAVTKSDVAGALDTRQCPGRLDVLACHLRELALPYGAALIFVSTNDNASVTRGNLELTYRYLMHRLYEFPFAMARQWVHKGAGFLPAGWETREELDADVEGTVAETLTTPLEALLPSPANADEAAAANEDSNAAPEVLSFNEFLATMLENDSHLLVKEKPAGSSSSGGGGTTAAASGGTTRLRSMQTELTVPGTARSSTTRSTEVGQRLVSEGSRQSRLQQSKGDTESLRAFFQGLLVSKPGPTPRTKKSAPADKS